MAAAAALVAAMAAQMLTAIPHAAPVVDEPAHLTSGYLALTQGDLTVNREHPPLVKTLAALPLLWMRPVLPPDRPGEGPLQPARATEDFEFDYSRRFLFAANDPGRLVGAARIPIVVLTLAGAVIVYLWGGAVLAGAGGGRSTLGALAALALFVFEPNLLAHGRLVTTDMGATLFTLGAFACLERSFAAASGAAGRRWAIGSGLFLGLALLSRFSCLLFVPLLALCAALDRRRPAGARALHAGSAVICALLLVSIGYGFTGGLFPLAHDPIGGRLHTEPLASMESSAVLRWVPIPLPRLYVEGLDLARHKNRTVEGPGYLNGHYSRQGWWSYFVQALAMKTTLPMLALATSGLLLIAIGQLSARAGRTGTEQRRRRARLALWVALPGAGIVLMVTAATRAQIGLRYVLPAVPFLCLAGGTACCALAHRLRGLRWHAGPALVAAILAWHAVCALLIHPYHLAYFNELAGGPDQGYRHLVDSNLDWGQDLVGLGRFAREKGLSRLNLYYFGTADPARYGIQASAPEPGYYAVSATHLMGVYLPDHDYLAAFRALPPVTTIGHSILIYHLDEVPASLKSR